MALLTRNWNHLFVVLFAFAVLWLASTGVGAPSPPESAVGQEAGNGTLEEKEFKPIGAIKIEYNLAKGSYAGLQSQLHQVLATSRIVDGIPVLVAQTFPGPPPTWILITITSGSAKVTVAVRNDNIYVAGFSNATAIWFAFQRFKRQITGSIELPRTDDYPSLIKGHDKLAGFDVSRQAVLQAVSFLSTYKVVKDDVHETTLGISLARLIVVVSEAARFKPIYETVEQGLKDQALMTDKEARLVVFWGKMSEWLMTGKWPKHDKELEKAGINGKQDGINSLKLLIWPKGVKVQHLGVAGNGTFCNNATSFCN